MGFFGIGTGEILIILVIALIIVGPHKLPELAKMLGKGFTEFKKAADDLKDSVNTEIHIEKERQKLIEIQPQEKKSEATETLATETNKTEKSEKKGNLSEDEEKKNLL